MTLGVAWYEGAVGRFSAFVLYPVLPWLAMMLLGWALASHLLRGEGVPSNHRLASALLAIMGFGSLGVFVLVRGLDGYGNLALFRPDSSWISWLMVSKYPPSLAFTALELGLLAILLSALMRLESRLLHPPSSVNPLLVFGQTPFFFYILHLPLLAGAASLLGIRRQGGLVETYIAAAGVCLVLYPLCRWYGRYRSTRRHGWTRYL
jgi:uncharacterized membrane protein